MTSINIIRNFRTPKANKTERNDDSLFVVMYLFQFSYLVIWIPVLSMSVSSMLSSMLILGAYALKRREHVFIFSPRVLVWCLLPISLIILKALQFPDGLGVVCNILFKYIAIGLLSIYFGSRDIDADSFWHWSTVFAFVSFFSLCFLPLVHLDRFEGYFRYGYAMLPIVNVFFKNCLENKRKRLLYFLFYGVSLLEMTVFGSRGALLSHGIFIAFIIFVIYRKKVLLKVTLCLTAIGIACYLEEILIFIKSIMNGLGYRVYAIDKYLLQLRQGFSSASSGRTPLWNSGIQVIQHNPLFGGSFDSSEEYGFDYYHNLFIQIGADFGVIVLLVASAAIIYTVIKACRSFDKTSQYLFFLFFSMAFGRLLVSSSYWLRPEIWMLSGMFFSNAFGKKQSHVKLKIG